MSQAPARPASPKTTFGERWYELLLAGRLLRSRRSLHLSLVTTMSVAGIALGVAALIVVMAVNTGFQAAFQDRILASYPHLVVMRRGVDVRDHRELVAKLLRVEGVRHVAPATYDDMMLSSAGGRAGAVVRGVPVETLAGLPEGAIVAGVLDKRGEAPVLRSDAPGWQVLAGVAGARHAVVVGQGRAGQPWSQTVPVLPQPSGLAGLMVLDVQGCGDAPVPSPNAEPAAGVYLATQGVEDPVRRGVRQKCTIVASWDAAPGPYLVRWLDGGIQREAPIELRNGRTSVAVLVGGELRVIPPPPDDLAPTLAGVAWLDLGATRLALRVPEQPPFAPTSTAEWHSFPAELPPITLGEGLAQRLQVKPGDEVRAVSPMRGLDRGADDAAGSASGRFRVAAIVRTGFHDHDQRMALVDFTAAQRFLGRGDIARWLEVRVDDPILAAARSESFRAALEPTAMAEVLKGAQTLRDKFVTLQDSGPIPGLELRAPNDAIASVDNWVSGVRAARQTRVRTAGAFRVIDWEEMNRNIFDAARMQKIAMSLFPFIIVLVAALNVVGTQAVVVHERARDIAILRAMGSSRRSVASIFLMQGLAVGVVGTLLGLLVGGVACFLLDAVGYPLDPQVYLISRLPVLVEASSFFLAGGAAIVLAFAAAWFAAQRAASRAPVEALRRLD